MWDPSDTTKYDRELYGMLTNAVSRVATDRKEFALCLDSSWTISESLKAAEVLAKHGATATFFVDSDTAKKRRNELKPLVKSGNVLGNQVKSGKPLETLSAMKVRDAMHVTQDYLRNISVPVAAMLPCSSYSQAIWNTMNYYQLMVVAPGLVVDSGANIGAIVSKLSAGDIVLLQNSDKALEQLDVLLSMAEKSGLKAVTFRKLVGGSKSRRLKSVLAASGADVETGME
jgi:peptidoglycan/xylan/chitin deacetylase (PgdA/CDA1 family)